MYYDKEGGEKREEEERSARDRRESVNSGFISGDAVAGAEYGIALSRNACTCARGVIKLRCRGIRVRRNPSYAFEALSSHGSSARTSAPSEYNYV